LNKEDAMELRNQKLTQGPETREEKLTRLNKMREEGRDLTEKQLSDRSKWVPIIDDRQIQPEPEDPSTDYSGQREINRLKLAGESADSDSTSGDSE
jgi:hypothetical protein